MSSGEKDSATPTADSCLTGPDSTPVSGIVVVETESPPATLSRRNTPISQSSQAARLLLSTSRSKKKEEEETWEKETLKEEENKEANSSTTVSSLSESEEGLNTQQLLKKENIEEIEATQRKNLGICLCNLSGLCVKIKAVDLRIH